MPMKTVETFPMGRRATLASCCIPILWELGTWTEALGLASLTVGEVIIDYKPGLGTQEQLANLAWL